MAFPLLKTGCAPVFGCSVFGAGCNLSIPENALWFADSRAIAGKVQPALFFREGEIHEMIPPACRAEAPGEGGPRPHLADGKLRRAPDVNYPDGLVHEMIPPLERGGPAQRSSPTQPLAESTREHPWRPDVLPVKRQAYRLSRSDNHVRSTA